MHIGYKLDDPEKTAYKEKLNILFSKKKDTPNGLLWCSFQNPLLMDFSEIANLVIPDRDNVYFYLERQDTIVRTNYDELIKAIDDLEPWQEFDGYIFDNSFNWIIAITHEDMKCLVLGL